MQNELDIVRDVSSRLDRRAIDYMLTGSIAMNYYAEPRMTRDIDIVVSLASASAKTIVRDFSTDYYVPEEALVNAIETLGMFNLIHLETVIKVDFIVRKDGEYRRHEFDRRQRVQMLGFSTCIVSKEDLILSKLDWARDSRSEFQLRDVRNLLRTGYDRAYVEAWVAELDLGGMWTELDE